MLFLQLNSSAQCIISNDYYPQSISNNNSFIWGQGFIAECNGVLEYIQLIAVSTGTVSAGTLKIYSGNNVNTIPIYTQSYPSININEPNDPIKINITQPLNLIQNNQYTFELAIDNVDVLADFSNHFKNGSAFENGVESPFVDFVFKVSITTTLGLEDPNEIQKLNIVPNPSKDFIKVNGLKENSSYIIYDNLGSEVKSGKIVVHDKIDIKKFAKGLYFLKIDKGLTLKFLKK